MIRCGACKHWDEGDGHRVIMGHMSIEPGRPVGWCRKARGSLSSGPMIFAAFGYAILTTADFGCILGEAGSPGSPADGQSAG